MSVTRRPVDRGENPRAARLAAGTSWPLRTAAPFHLEATVRLLQRRPTNRVDIWEDDCYRRVLSTPDGPSLVEISNLGSIDEPDLRFAILSGESSTASRAFIEASLRRTLGLDLETSSVHRWAVKFDGLRSTALALRGMRPPRFPDLFETLGSVIPFQQLSLDAGISIIGRLVDRFGADIEFDGRRWSAFPRAEEVAALELESLKSVGLSRAKAETLHRLACRIASGALTEERLVALSTTDALAALTKERGIGPWTATVVLLRGFGRTEVFPPNDTGVARGLGALLSLKPGPISSADIARFGDNRGYLYFYSLGAQLLGRRLITPAPDAPENCKLTEGIRQ
jgi:DNA-3-methyladenine glycosylase II